MRRELISIGVKCESVTWEVHMTEQKEIERNCPECDGTGQERGMQPVRLGAKNEFRPCTKCGGSGKIKEAAN